MRFIFGGEPVSINRFGIGVMVDRCFIPDGWDGDPLRLVLVERGKKTLAMAVCASEVEHASADLVPMRLIEKAWEFMDGRNRAKE